MVNIIAPFPQRHKQNLGRFIIFVILSEYFSPYSGILCHIPAEFICFAGFRATIEGTARAGASFAGK